ncbi:MAG: cupin domain-containing protein [Leptospiraceae bacterium]|nr:cupin domain-containing protein [Leptospiraceae bacterium]MCP5495986.1 cupin domain-containing protein [Leptospiraceae bacterium]
MKTFLLLLLLLIISACDKVNKDTNAQMVITRKEDQTKLNVPAKLFTGPVEVKGLLDIKEPHKVSGALVTFPPKSRSNWHTHPMGQLLIVTEGTGLIQQWGGKIQIIKNGDVVWTPPGVKHWHGASKEESMSHIAIQESKNGKNVEWLEAVSDEQYNQQN